MGAQGARAELYHQHLSARPAQAVKIPQQAELVDEDAMSQIRKGHDTMCVVLTSRHKNLDTVRAVWTTGDIKASAYPQALGRPQKKAAPGRAVGLGGPCHHAVADFASVSAIVIITSCHLLTAPLRAWPHTRHRSCSLVNRPQQSPSSRRAGRGRAIPVPSDRRFVCTDVGGLGCGHQ